MGSSRSARQPALLRAGGWAPLLVALGLVALDFGTGAIQAAENGLRNALAGAAVTRIPAVQTAFLVLAVAYLVCWAPRRFSRAGLGLVSGLCVGLLTVEGALLHGGLWLPLVLSVAALLLGQLALWAVDMAKTYGMASDSEAHERRRLLGLTFHGQGRLDEAYAQWRPLPLTPDLMTALQQLALDFERRRQWSRAKRVFKHMLRHDRQHAEARAGYQRVRQIEKALSSARKGVPGADGVLGRYRLERALGKGAMGVVYLGRDPQMGGRALAIKTLALEREFEGASLVDARERFFREAETAGQLQHPNIVTIFDAGEENDLAYIAMEFLPGRDLSHAAQPGHLLPWPQVVSIGARVADALDYAHAHQVIHRDIKPANIMFDASTDTVKVTDFGIARITDSNKTRTGLVLGTPSFMPPEQLAGQRVDGRADLYALGATLFQLLTGVLPLRGDSLSELMHKIAHMPAPDVRSLRPELPGDLAEVVARLLRKSPQERYQTGAQLAMALRSAGRAESFAMDGGNAVTVVYDATRDATRHDMADYQTTVMDGPALPSGATAGGRFAGAL